MVNFLEENEIFIPEEAEDERMIDEMTFCFLLKIYFMYFYVSKYPERVRTEENTNDYWSRVSRKIAFR